MHWVPAFFGDDALTQYFKMDCHNSYGQATANAGAVCYAEGGVDLQMSISGNHVDNYGLGASFGVGSNQQGLVTTDWYANNWEQVVAQATPFAENGVSKVRADFSLQTSGYYSLAHEWDNPELSTWVNLPAMSLTVNNMAMDDQP